MFRIYRRILGKNSWNEPGYVIWVCLWIMWVITAFTGFILMNVGGDDHKDQGQALNERALEINHVEVIHEQRDALNPLFEAIAGREAGYPNSEQGRLALRQ